MTTIAIIESPFANSNATVRNENLLYVNVVARKVSLDSEGQISPLFFHSFYTQFLHDDIDEERLLGLEMSFAHHNNGDIKLVTIDRGISKGMVEGVKAALKQGKDVKFFTLCSANSQIAQEVSEINSIESVEERWKKGFEAFSALEVINELGDCTNFRTNSEALYSSVSEIINDFFSPLTEYTKRAYKTAA